LLYKAGRDAGQDWTLDAQASIQSVRLQAVAET